MRVIDGKGPLIMIINILVNYSYDEYRSITYICDVTDYSKSTVERTLFLLRRRGFLIAKQGCNGGYKLTRPLGDIKINDLSSFTTAQQTVLRMSLSFIKDMTLLDFVKGDDS